MRDSSRSSSTLRELINEYLNEYYSQVIRPTVTDRDVQIYGGASGDVYGYYDYGYEGDYGDDGGDLDEADSYEEGAG